MLRATDSSVTMPSHATFSLNQDIILFSDYASDSISILYPKDTNMPVQQQNNRSLWEKEDKQENPKR